MIRCIDETGNKYGRLTVKNRDGTDKHRSAVWSCVCDCGNEVSVRGDRLRSGRSRSCGCLHREITSEIHKLPAGEASFNRLYRDYRASAKRKGMEFTLKKKQFHALSSLNCYYCDIYPSQVKRYEGCNGEYIYNGIDRLDNEVGYTTENSVACCEKCNMAKRTMTQEVFYGWVYNTYHHVFDGNVSQAFALGRRAYE